MAKHIPRVYVADMESLEFEVPCSSAIHLIAVLRLKDGDEFIAFNKDFGEWKCEISRIKKNIITAKKIELLREFKESARLCLAFCIIKHDDAAIALEKATELGVTDIYPIISEFSSNVLKSSKLCQTIIGAAEQSERLDIPYLHEPLHLSDFIKNLPDDILWISAIEKKEGVGTLNNINVRNNNCGFIIGPAGGFSEKEKVLLAENTVPVTISRNILRAETAAIACLSFYNSHNC